MFVDNFKYREPWLLNRHGSWGPSELTDAMSKPAKDVYYVLIADDSEADRFLMKTALRQASCLQIIAEVSDGTDAIAYLRGHAEFSDRQKFPLPDLLLLDLKMPLQDGFEVLEWLNEQPCQGLTVVVLTDSMQTEHIKRRSEERRVGKECRSRWSLYQ